MWRVEASQLTLCVAVFAKAANREILVVTISSFYFLFAAQWHLWENERSKSLWSPIKIIKCFSSSILPHKEKGGMCKYISPSLTQLTHPYLTNANFILRLRTSYTLLPLSFKSKFVSWPDSAVGSSTINDVTHFILSYRTSSSRFHRLWSSFQKFFTV